MSTNPFVGAWRLVSAQARTAGGDVSHPLGSATGYLIYSEDGYMAVAIMENNRPQFAAPDMRAGRLEEKLAAFDTYLSYCGTYEVRGERVIHHVELSLFPNWSGADQERFYEFSEDRLILRSPPMVIEGVERTAHLTWRRATGG
jgi:hypothetical protein